MKIPGKFDYMKLTVALTRSRKGPAEGDTTQNAVGTTRRGADSTPLGRTPDTLY